MRLIPLGIVFSALASVANAAAGDPVLLAGSRGGWIEAISLETLETVARVRVPVPVESVASDPSGERLFVRAPRSPENGCCAIFALDPQSMQLSFLIEPAQSITVTAGRLYTQRGSVGIEVFDSQNLGRLPTVKAPGVYRLRTSPDGRFLSGITNWPKPSLDLFDTGQGSLIASVAAAGPGSLAGAWLGQQYFLFTVQSGQARLWSMSPDRWEPGRAVSLSSSGSFPDCEQTPYDVIAAGGRLAIYGQFGLKSNGACATPGGFVIADPVSGVVTEHFASNLNFRQMVASSDGQYLYGLDVGSPAWQRVRIVKIDAMSGQTIGERTMEAGVWYLTTGLIPHEMEGHLDLVASIPPRL